jgi:carbon storage regulator
MLVLNRKIGEQIQMPDHDISITVLAVKGKTVRLGITAPDHIHVVRSEILQQVRESDHQPLARD